MELESPDSPFCPLLLLLLTGRHYEDFQLIMKNIFGALKEPARNWRVIFKGLTLLDYMIKNGSERVIEHAREKVGRVRALTAFKFMDGVHDRGTGECEATWPMARCSFKHAYRTRCVMRCDGLAMSCAAGVAEKSKQIVELLKSNKELRAERKKARVSLMLACIGHAMHSSLVIAPSSTVRGWEKQKKLLLRGHARPSRPAHLALVSLTALCRHC